jgi:hypothetical protein
VPIGRVLQLPVPAFINAVSGLAGGDVMLAGNLIADTKELSFNRWVARINKDDKIQLKTLGAGTFNAIQARPDGSALVGGNKPLGVKPGDDDAQGSAFIAMIARDNKVIWEQTFAGEGSSTFDSIALLPNGGALGVGLRAPVSGTTCGLVGVVTERGEKLWEDTSMPQNRFLHAKDVAVLASGRILAVGGSYAPTGLTLYDAWIALYEPSGKLIIKRGLDIRGWAPAEFVTGISDGGAMSVGLSRLEVDHGDVQASVLVIRMDANADVIWKKSIGEHATLVSDVIEVQGGIMFVVSKVEQPHVFSSFLVKVGLDGRDTWEAIQIDSKYRVTSLAPTPDGGLVLLARPPVDSHRPFWIGRSGPR